MFNNKITLYPPSKRPEPDREILVCFLFGFPDEYENIWDTGEYWPEDDKFHDGECPDSWENLNIVGWIYTDYLYAEVINA